MKRVAMLGLMALAACSDALEQDTTAGQVIAVTEYLTATASLVSAENLVVTHTITLPSPASGFVSGLGSVLIVPIVGGATVIDLTRSFTPVNGLFPLAAGTFGRGSAIQDSAVAWVTYEMPFALLPSGTVWRVNYRTGDTASIAFADNPKAIAIAAGKVFVVTVGAGDVSWLTVIDTILAAGSPRISIVDTVPLTGLNAGGITLGRDGYLYVVSSGPLAGGGATEGRLSIVDPVSRVEVAVVNGLGEALGPPLYHSSGRVLIPSVNGILEVNPATRSVTIGPSKGIKPAGNYPNVLVADQRGQLYALVDHCADPNQPPGAVQVLSPPPAYSLLKMIEIGSCPVGAAAAQLP
jgi:sugar lactone lactonase YvrE